jgi:hypothetical protein
MSAESSSSGIGLSGAVFVLFLGLKLTHLIAWSWWLVTAPLWGTLAATLVLAVVLGLVGLIVVMVKP